MNGFQCAATFTDYTELGTEILCFGSLGSISDDHRRINLLNVSVSHSALKKRIIKSCWMCLRNVSAMLRVSNFYFEGRRLIEGCTMLRWKAISESITELNSVKFTVIECKAG